MSEELVFDDLSLREIPVRIAGKPYTLREANGEAACKYRNAMLSAARVGPDGKPVGVSGLADIEPLLVSLCLFDSDSGKSVDVVVVRSWPSRIVSKLYEKARDISGLKEGEEAPKNGPSGTPTG